MANFLSNCKQMESKHTSKNKLVTKILICPADCKNYAIYFLKIVYIELRIGTKSRQYFKVQFERSVSAFTVSGHDEYWPLSHFWCHHLWQKLTKILPVIPISGWPAQWTLRYAQKCSKITAKNSEQSFLPLHYTLSFWEIFELGASPIVTIIGQIKSLKM